MLVTIRPTASADDDKGIAPKMLTERSCASNADRSDRISAVVRTADDTASAAWPAVPLNDWAVDDAPRSTDAAISIVFATLVTVSWASLRSSPIRPFAQAVAAIPLTATTSPTMPPAIRARLTHRLPGRARSWLDPAVIPG
jgi:hypothetical protein